MSDNRQPGVARDVSALESDSTRRTMIVPACGDSPSRNPTWRRPRANPVHGRNMKMCRFAANVKPWATGHTAWLWSCCTLPGYYRLQSTGLCYRIEAVSPVAPAGFKSGRRFQALQLPLPDAHS